VFHFGVLNIFFKDTNGSILKKADKMLGLDFAFRVTRALDLRSRVIRALGFRF